MNLDLIESVGLFLIWDRNQDDGKCKGWASVCLLPFIENWLRFLCRVNFIWNLEIITISSILYPLFKLQSLEFYSYNQHFMLSFSANSRPVTQGPPTKQFEYFVISNDPPKHNNPPRVPNPKQKSIVRTAGSQPKQPPKHSSTSLNQPHNKDFSHSVTQPKLFNQRLKQGELAAEQRRIQNQFKKMHKEFKDQEFETIPQKVQSDVLISQKQRVNNLHKKSMEKSQKEMTHLQKLIEQEKRQKLKNDKQFQEKEKALSGELRKLKMIESQIRKVRNPNHPEPQNSVNLGNTNQRNSYYPQPEAGSKPNHNPQHYIDGEQERERKKKQLAVLMGRRDKLQKYQNPLKYTPTLIPLLSKASYRIISTHIAGITQLLIDDILLQQVLILQQIQERQREQHQRKRERMMLQDYVTQVGQMVRDNDLIQNRIGNYTKLDFFEWHKPPHQPSFLKQKQPQYQTYETITLYMTSQMKTGIYKNLDKYQKFRKYRDEYEKGNLRMFGEATQELIQEIIDDLVQELEKGSSEFVQTIFKHQFK